MALACTPLTFLLICTVQVRKLTFEGPFSAREATENGLVSFFIIL